MTRRAVMFDLDGTLLDTLADLGAAANEALRARAFPEHDLAFYRHAVGDGARNLALRSLPATARDAAAIDALFADMRANYARNWRHKTRPYDGIPALLAALRAAGCTMAILSNKPDDMTQACVNHFFPDSAFAAVRGVVKDGPLKPDPAGALDIVNRLGIPGEAWLYMGDTNTDMQTARAAGLFAVGCTWGFRDRAELVAAGADAIVDRPEELLGLLAMR
jgi:phosphoglycolate phosphatase